MAGVGVGHREAHRVRAALSRERIASTDVLSECRLAGALRPQQTFVARRNRWCAGSSALHGVMTASPQPAPMLFEFNWITGEYKIPEGVHSARMVATSTQLAHTRRDYPCHRGQIRERLCLN